MTQENKSVLKTALGLENLKGLGDVLKQLKEVMGKAEEFQKLADEIAKENSPLAKAIADRFGAETLQILKEGDVTALEEWKTKIEEENEKLKEGYTAVVEENKQLKEDKVVSEVAATVKEELDRRLPPLGSGNDSGGSKLFKAIEDVVAKKLEQLLDGGGEGTLTSEQVRSVIKEEVAAVAGGNKKPEDMIDDLVNALSIGDRLKEKLGVTGIGARLVQDQGGDSGLRTDLVKALLEDERERLKITQNHEAEMQRNQHLGTLAGAIKENLSDGIAAITAAVEEAKGSPGTKRTESESQPQTFSCGDCQTQFSAPSGWAGQPLKCPNPQCGREYTKEELEA